LGICLNVEIDFATEDELPAWLTAEGDKPEGINEGQKIESVKLTLYLTTTKSRMEKGR